jgi:fructose-1,6-bisphosphatase I
VGSIFGIYEPSETCIVDGDLDQSLEACITNVCQPGKNLLVAGYCLYSSCHTMVLTIGDGVYGFTLDPYVGEFVLTHNRIQVGLAVMFCMCCCAPEVQPRDQREQ